MKSEMDVHQTQKTKKIEVYGETEWIRPSQTPALMKTALIVCVRLDRGWLETLTTLLLGCTKRHILRKLIFYIFSFGTRDFYLCDICILALKQFTFL